MLRLQDNEKLFIRENLDSPDALIASENVNDILDPLDEWIAMNGFDDAYNLTDEGRIAQRIYDSIYLNNA